MPNHGGKRTNAGRPKKISRPVDITLYLEQYQVDWLKQQPGSISEVIRSLVDKAIKSNK